MIGEVSLSVALIGLATLLVVFLFLKSLFNKRHIFRFSQNFGGHRFYPLIGNGFHIYGKNIFHAVRDTINKYGLPCNMWLGHDYNYITADAAEIKVTLNHPNTFDKMRIYENLELGFGQSLILAPVDIWKKHRKYFSKSFSQPLLNSFVQYFYKKSVILLEILKDMNNKDIFEVFERFTFDSFTESIIGIDYDLQVNPKVKLVESVGEIQALGGKRLITYFYYPMFLWLIFSNEGRRAIRLMKQINTFVEDVIKKKRQFFAENPVCLDSGAALPLLDSMLLASKEKFTNKQIFEEMFLFSTAATDTTGYTLAYIFTMIGMHPDVQEKVFQEVMTEVGLDRPVYFEDLPNLKYTERVIFETMRILPVTPFFGRKATANINFGDKVIPKGTNIFISIFDLHRSEKYWPDPLKFDPDRFLPEEVAKREPYTYLPFSGGPRNCIGKTYSIMVMKTCIATVIRRYEISSPYRSVTDLELKSCITMKTIHPLECEFKPRKLN